MTNKQKQCLLCYLGYYVGKIDGIWGEKSLDATICFQDDFGGISVDGICGEETEKALKHAVAYGMPEKEVVVPEVENTTDDFWDGVKHFKRGEFKCKCERYCDGFPVEPDERLVELLDTIREHFGVPVTVTSGIRCGEHNENVGGVADSQHLKGTAADIKVRGVDPKEVAAYAETLLPNSGGIGIYGTFTHVDVRSRKSRWNG